jgi:serine/threonine protein kinase
MSRGATSVAYRARDPRLDRVVVVKVVLLPADLSDKEGAAFEARFLEETRRASRLTHPGLVPIHDCGKDPETGALFVVQEHVKGTPLSELLAPGEPRPLEEALHLVGGVGRALQHLHAGGLTHGDVQPSNIVLQDSGLPRLADAGIPRVEVSRLTLAGVLPLFGVPLYTSPEQAVGEKPDAQSDLFALAAVAYRLLTGRDAFEADGPTKILARVLHDRPRSPVAVVPGLPAGVDLVLAKALAKSRKDRYSNAMAFCDDLDDLLAGRPPANAPSGLKKEDTATFLVGASADTLVGETTGMGSVRLHRRPFVRAFVGLVALALVGGLELLRRELETSDATPGARPAADPLPRAEDPKPKSASGLPSIEQASAPTARLSVDFRHTLETGTLVVSVDGAKVLERGVSGVIKRSVLGIKLREGRLQQVVALSPGRHEITVRVLWGDDERTSKIAGNFSTGVTRRLSARVGRIGKDLSIEWE